jgi:hypothetical protein
MSQPSPAPSPFQPGPAPFLTPLFFCFFLAARFSLRRPIISRSPSYLAGPSFFPLSPCHRHPGPPVRFTPTSRRPPFLPPAMAHSTTASPATLALPLPSTSVVFNAPVRTRAASPLPLPKRHHHRAPWH